jgi:hypothetical protein
MCAVRIRTWLLAMPLCAGMAACAPQAAVHPFAQYRTYAPSSTAVADIPANIGGSEAYQDHRGPAVAMGSAPALNDTGSERIPDYPSGAEPPITGGHEQVIMPNGGETIVQSANSLPN